MIDVERRTGVALWRQIADRMRAGLLEDLVDPRGKLPAEMTLAQHYGVNRHTVRAAISSLVQEGLLRSEQGRGTFLAAPQSEAFGLTRKTVCDPCHMSEERVELVASKRVTAPADVAKKLMVPEGSRVVTLETAVYAGKTPVSRATSWFDAMRFSDMGKFVRGSRSITKAFAKCGVDSVSRQSTLVEARPATGDDLDELDLSAGGLVLITKTVTQDAHRAPVQYIVTRFAADRVHVCMDDR